eukprot:TRINITY_DN31742_c0_g1_i1.p2 TRINITY_DN31742_c0_g1~~TRINITY_DN31742_c0_g1_i1.p2  ORF type:complete len:124 (+),score=29.55 TRINITY_DN31742_c0_g1_i1:22-393(+)
MSTVALRRFLSNSANGERHYVQFAAVPRRLINNDGFAKVQFQERNQQALLWVSHSSNDDLHKSWIDNPPNESSHSASNRLAVWFHQKASKGDQFITEFVNNNRDRQKSNAIKQVRFVPFLLIS